MIMTLTIVCLHTAIVVMCRLEATCVALLNKCC